MVEKKHIENFLKLNGLTAVDDEASIRAALQTARWSEEDIEEAFKVLKGEGSPEKVELIASRQLFTSDAHVDPDTLSKLLGIKAPGSASKFPQELRETKSKLWVVFAYALSVCIVGGGVAFMLIGLLNMFEITAP